MSNYIGITIGPIVDTLRLAHSPAAMWYASYMFSTLTKRICDGIYDMKPDENSAPHILSPHYEKQVHADGIGRYHDRIILRDADECDIKDIICGAVRSVAEEIADTIGSSLPDRNETVKFMRNYFQVHYALLENEESDGEAIIRLGYILDCLEQMPSPNADNDHNPFARLFKDREKFRNEHIREKVKSLKSTQLKNSDGTFRSITEIAGKDKKLKRDSYYALVEADGDGMGKYIESLGGHVKEFSEKCFGYAEEAAKLIGDFGGMTVYAGGDDLFFLSPVCGKDGRTVFDLCRDISKKFNEKMTELKRSTGISSPVPTLSFGIAIRREAFPLYETLSSGLDALYKAKSDEVGKNSMVIDFRKGSGQVLNIAVPFEKYELFDKIFKTYLSENADDLLKSAIYVFDARKHMFAYNAIDSQIIKNIVTNTFDNEGQKKYKKFVNNLACSINEFFIDCEKREQHKIFAYDKDGSSYEPVKTFEAILRLSKFMTEEGAEENVQLSD